MFFVLNKNVLKHSYVLSFYSATRATIKMTEDMAKLGADAVMVVTPSYYKTLMNVFQFY